MPIELIAVMLVGCSHPPPVPAELSPFTEMARALFRAEHVSDTAAIRLLVAGDAGFAAANALERLHPDLVSDGLRSLRPQVPFELSKDSAYVEYRMGDRTSPRDVVAINFVRRDSAWRIVSVGLAGFY